MTDPTYPATNIAQDLSSFPLIPLAELDLEAHSLSKCLRNEDDEASDAEAALASRDMAHVLLRSRSVAGVDEGTDSDWDGDAAWFADAEAGGGEGGSDDVEDGRAGYST